MTEPELGDLLRRADPAAHVRDRRGPAEIAEAVREIVASPRVDSSGGRTRRWPWIALPSAAALVALVLLVVPILTPCLASRAATPPLLAISPTSRSLGAVMDQALAQLERLATGDPRRGATFEGWYLQTDVESTASSTSPQRHVLTWRDDLSGELTVTAGEPFGDAEPAGPAPGSVLVSERYAAGEAPIVFRAPPPAGTRELRAYLAEARGEEVPDAVGYLSAMRTLLSEWRLTTADHATLLRILRSSEGVEVAGDVTDRLGRPGTALRITSPRDPHFEYLAVISRETGALIAIETVYLGGLAELAAPAPCVVDYIAWT